MKIAINCLSARAGGGISVFLNLLPALYEIDKQNEYVVFVSADQKEIIDQIPESFKTVRANFPKNPYVRVLWEQFIFPLLFMHHGIDLLYSVGNTTILLAPCKIVLLIENANPYSRLKSTNSSTKPRNLLLRILTYLSVKKASVVRFVSENSREIIARRLTIPPEKCTVIYHGFNHAPGSEQHKNICGSNYILYVSAVLRHKNMEQLIRGFQLFIKATGYGGKLLIIGEVLDPGYHARLLSLSCKSGLEDKVIFTGKVQHGDIGEYYTGADAFVFPSLEETFGLPVIEAMGYGVPIAVSDAPEDMKGIDLFIPFRELCGSAAHYFNPFDPADISESMKRIVFDGEYRSNLANNALSRVKMFSWKDTALNLVTIFNSLNKECTNVKPGIVDGNKA